MNLTIDQNEVKLTNLEKILWPETGYTKKDLIDYYIKIYPDIKEYLKQRPVSLKIYPDGIKGKSFYRKNCPDYAPEWLTTASIYSKHNKQPIKWIIINKLADLVWIANHSSIELHCWFSTIKNLDNPDFAVFDLDPGTNTTINNTITIANLTKNILDELKLNSFVKTSGKSGLHIFIPVRPIYSYKQIKHFLKLIARIIIKAKPALATTEWRKNKREGKLYLDYRQISRGKTLPAPFSLRPTSLATVSTPLHWSEVKPGLKPEYFNLENINHRLSKDKYKSLWDNILEINQNLPGMFF